MDIKQDFYKENMTNWANVKIGDFIKVTSGGTPSRKKPEYYNEGKIPWIKTGDLKCKELFSSGEFINEKGLKNSSAKLFPPGTVLIALYGATIGACSILRIEAATNQACAALIPNKKIDPVFLYYFLRHQKPKLIAAGVGGAQPNISGQIIKSTVIPLPPLPTQRRIAAILDQADALRRKDQELLAKYDELVGSVFLEMFGDPMNNEKKWEEKKLKEVCVKITDGTHHSPPLAENGIPYVTAKHVKNYGLDFGLSPTFVERKYHEPIYARCNPEFGDILYIKDGATTGIACINTFKEEISMLSSLALIKPDKKQLDNWYLCHWLNNERVKEKLVRTEMAGAAIKRYTLKKIKEFKILIPPISSQKKFASIIDNIELQKGKMKAQIEKSEELFQSLLQKAFRGEL